MKKSSGQFKTKHKLIEFIGTKGNVNFISNEAIIEGKQLSGLGLDDMKFKLTLYEDETVDLDDIDGQETTSQLRENLLIVIFEKNITGFKKKMVISELTFTSIQEFDGKKVPLYLVVEYKKPIEKMALILEEELIPELNQNQLDRLNDLFSILDEEFEVEIEETLDDVNQSLPEEFNHSSKLEEEFERLKLEKIESLKLELQIKNDELQKLEREKKLNESKISKTNSEILLIESRLAQMQPANPPNGIIFNLSERLNEKIELEDNIFELIKNKVSKVKSINVDAFMNLFKQGEFQIRFAKKDSDELIEQDHVEIDSESLRVIEKMGFGLKGDKFFFSSEISWAEIVNKLTQLGFEQDPEWDKICQSNSYKSELSPNSI